MTSFPVAAENQIAETNCCLLEEQGWEKGSHRIPTPLSQGWLGTPEGLEPPPDPRHLGKVLSTCNKLCLA